MSTQKKNVLSIIDSLKSQIESVTWDFNEERKEYVQKAFDECVENINEYFDDDSESPTEARSL